MIISEEAYKVMYSYPGMPQFIYEVSLWVKAYFQERHELYISVYRESEHIEPILNGTVRLEKYDDSCMVRINEINDMYKNSRLGCWFCLGTDYIPLL